MGGMHTLLAVKAELDQLTHAFFESASFEQCDQPSHQQIHRIFVEQGLLIKSGQVPEISKFVTPV